VCAAGPSLPGVVRGRSPGLFTRKVPRAMERSQPVWRIFSWCWCRVGGMAITSRAQLRAELHCLSHDGQVVMTAQLWFDPQAPMSRPVSWIRLIRNGKIHQDSRVSGAAGQLELVEFWVERALVIAPARLEEDQMWSKLAELTGKKQTVCVRRDCAGQMPVGWWFCPVCGCDARNVASGSLSGVRRQGDLLLDLRVRPEHPS
jgi:hypothetical protein